MYLVYNYLQKLVIISKGDKVEVNVESGGLGGESGTPEYGNVTKINKDKCTVEFDEPLRLKRMDKWMNFDELEVDIADVKK